MNQNMVVFASGGQAGRLAGVTVRANFVVSGERAPGWSSHALLPFTKWACR